MISPTCFSMVCSGLSDVIGSWKIIEMRSPRMARMLGFVQLSGGPCPRTRSRPSGARRTLGSSRRIDSAETVLPEPDSPTSATVSPLAMLNDTPLTTRDALVAFAEVDREVPDVDEGRGCVVIDLPCLNVLRGSSASRTASPMKIDSDRMIDTATKPEMPSHGASRCFLPCSSSSPSDGEPGGMPRPEEVERGQRRDARPKA